MLFFYAFIKKTKNEIENEIEKRQNIGHFHSFGLRFLLAWAILKDIYALFWDLQQKFLCG